MVAASILAAFPTRAEVAISGYFVAGEACEAPQSIRTGANPGDVRLEPSRTYPLLAKNKEDATHFLLSVEGANPQRRWVPITCGERLVAEGEDGPAPVEDAVGDAQGAERAKYLLAVSWQPAFCETRPTKKECETQTADRADADHFTLHGLWPQPRGNEYCHVDPGQAAADRNGRWQELEAPVLAEETRQRLEAVMPGTMSFLERHEWVKHGTCYPADTADEYFRTAVALVEQLNGSEVRTLFASSIGQVLQTDDIVVAFDRAFGEGSGMRVTVSCSRDDGRRLIAEVRIGLGDLDPEPSLGAAMARAAPAKRECDWGVVDQVGLQ